MSTRMPVRLVRLKRLLRSTDEYSPEQKQAIVEAEVQLILEAVPDQSEEDQQYIRAAPYQMGPLPDRRGQAQQSGSGADGAERRQERDLSQWLGE